MRTSESKDTSKSMILCRFEPEVRNRTRGNCGANFGFAALALFLSWVGTRVVDGAVRNRLSNRAPGARLLRGVLGRSFRPWSGVLGLFRGFRGGNVFFCRSCG